MIECSAEKIYYKKSSKGRKRRFFRPFAGFLIIIGLILYYTFAVTDSVYFALSAYIEQYSLEAINQASKSTIGQSEDYSEFITVEKNQSGDIVLMKSNTQKINSVKTEISLKTQSGLKKKLNDGIDIPFMAFSGLKFLSGYGSKVNFKSISISSVNASFDGEFRSVGINQTLHSIYIKVLVRVSVEMTGRSKIFENFSTILISEAVLVGKVPDTYLNGKLF